MPLREVAGLGFFLFAVTVASADDAAVKAFDRSWASAREHVYPASLTDRFDADAERRLRAEAAKAPSLEAFAETFNAFLDGLGRSHTRFVTADDADFPFFKSLFGTHSVDSPSAFQFGAQLSPDGDGWRVRAVLDGSPAAQAALHRGDRIVLADGKPFHPVRSLRERRSVVLTVHRGKMILEPTVAVQGKNPHRAFVEATRASARIVEKKGKRIGYVHLWAGTDDENLKAFREGVATATKGGVDALVVDLRDGFGGAWWPYLDDFYADSSTYFRATFVDRAGVRREQKAPAENHPKYFAGRLVVLVNEGTRSGKEALAQFFKTSGRATLVGARTAGAVASGRMFFAEEDVPYLLYLSAGGVEIDGVDLEGKGVEPHRKVRFPLAGVPLPVDPQLEAAWAAAAE